MNIDNLYTTATKLTRTVERSILLATWMCILSILTVIIIFVIQYNRPQEVYFAVSASGKQIAINSLEEINVSTRSLLNWAMVAATNAYTMDFVNYKKSLQQMSEFFTKDGYQSFTATLSSSGRLNDIIDNKLIATAVVVDSPIIISEGTSGLNDYFWKIQLPIAITYQGPSTDVYKQWLAINLLIKKVATSEAKQGIGIESITANTMGAIY
jgi:intracellular multiplication protein IcmL